MDETNREMPQCARDVSQFMLDDLQLAAELGKTLLERNRELEIFLKEYKSKGDEQEREIVHLRKHINAMTEVNDSRLKVYEQLEVGIQDLERTNQRLNIEKNSDKKLIKTISCNTEILESRCEELSQLLNESKKTLCIERRRSDRLQQELNSSGFLADKKIGDRSDHGIISRTDYNIKFDFNCKATDHHLLEHRNIANSTGVEDLSPPNDSPPLGFVNKICDKFAAKGEDSEELAKLISDLELMKRELLTEQKRSAELEEQLMAIIQENQDLQTRLAQNNSNEEMMSMHDEFSLLDDVRQGQMCCRCLGVIDGRTTNIDEQSSVDQIEEMYEDDEHNMTDLENHCEIELATNHISQFSNCTPGCSYKERFRDSLNPKAIDNSNPYRDLVQKYEALVEVQRTSIAAMNIWGTSKDNEQANKLSSNILNLKSVGTHANKKDGIVNDKSKKTVVVSNNRLGRTPTEFSELESSSSGYSDDTSNKYTQTDDRPGYFLCSISDGKDCKFSIYDDVSPIDSHFRHRPEYRELFKEIFGVLKKAAQNNEVGEKLPFVQEESHTVNRVTSKTAVTSPVMIEEQMERFIDETQSIASSVTSNLSIAISECVTKIERKTAKKHINDFRSYQNKSPMNKEASNSHPNVSKVKSSVCETKIKPIEENGRIFTPIKREPLEYLTVGVGIKKKNRRKHRNISALGDRFERKLWDNKRSSTSGDHFGNVNYTPKCSENFNTDVRGLGRDDRKRSSDLYNNWNGSQVLIYNRNINTSQSASGRVIELNGIEFYHNTVSQELHKLKKLDLSYADVLRRADTCEHMHSKYATTTRKRPQFYKEKSLTSSIK